VITAGAQLDWNEIWDGRWIVSLQIRQGLKDLWGGLDDEDPDASRLGAGGGFTKPTLLIYRIQRIADWLHLIGKFNAQYSHDPLVVSEQIGLGGPDSVRGYPSFEYAGDRGWTATVEARIKFPFIEGEVYDMLQFVIFHDWGKASLINPTFGEQKRDRLTALGVGVRFDYPEWGSVRVDLGYPGTSDPSDENDPHLWISVLFNLQ
jgi:hemolysin activation/secretion protein